MSRDKTPAQKRRDAKWNWGGLAFLGAVLLFIGVASRDDGTWPLALLGIAFVVVAVVKWPREIR